MLVRLVRLVQWVREVGLEPTRPKTQVPKTCVSAISPLPQVESVICSDLDLSQG